MMHNYRTVLLQDAFTRMSIENHYPLVLLEKPHLLCPVLSLQYLF